MYNLEAQIVTATRKQVKEVIDGKVQLKAFLNQNGKVVIGNYTNVSDAYSNLYNNPSKIIRTGKDKYTAELFYIRDKERILKVADFKDRELLFLSV